MIQPKIIFSNFIFNCRFVKKINNFKSTNYINQFDMFIQIDKNHTKKIAYINEMTIS